MYEFMSTHPEYMTGSNDEGLERAKAGKYAYLMESSSIEYIIERHCEVLPSFLSTHKHLTKEIVVEKYYRSLK